MYPISAFFFYYYYYLILFLYEYFFFVRPIRVYRLLGIFWAYQSHLTKIIRLHVEQNIKSNLKKKKNWFRTYCRSGRNPDFNSKYLFNENNNCKSTGTRFSSDNRTPLLPHQIFLVIEPFFLILPKMLDHVSSCKKKIKPIGHKISPLISISTIQ